MNQMQDLIYFFLLLSTSTVELRLLLKNDDCTQRQTNFDLKPIFFTDEHQKQMHFIFNCAITLFEK